MATDLTPVFQAAGKAFNVDPALLQAVQGAESGGNPNAVSPAGAIGNMQFMPATARAVGIDPRDPVQSVWGAANLLRQNLDATQNDVPSALKMYNAGPDRSRWNNPETAAYVSRVAQHYVASPSPTQGAPMPTAPVSAQDAATAIDPLSAGDSVAAAPAAPPSASAPDAYSALFGDTAPKPAANSNTPAPASANAYGSLFGDTDPQAVKASSTWHQGSWLNTAASAGKDFVEGVGKGLDHAALGAVNLVPGASSVLQGTGLDPQKLAPADAALAQDAASTPGGTIAAGVGNFVGQATAGMAAGEGAGALVGKLGGYAANALGGTAGQAVQAGTNLLAGGTAGGTAANLLTKATSGAFKGAVGGVGATGSTDGLLTNALMGGAAAPILSLVAPVVGSAASVTGQGINKLGAKVLNSLASPVAKTGAPIAEQIAPDIAQQGSAGINPLAQGSSAPAEPPVQSPVQPPAIAPTPPLSQAPDAPAPAKATDAPVSAPQAEQQTPPEAVRLGIFSSPDDAAKLGQQVYDSYAAGGPVQLVQSKIPGVQLTAAQATGNPGLALLERNRRAANPAPFVALDQQNAAARNAYAQQIVGTPEQLEQARGALAQMDAQSRPQVFGNQQPVDTAPIKAEVQAAIDANKGRPTVQAPLQNVLKQIQAVEIPSAATDGEEPAAAMAMPGDLWNVRKYLSDMVAPRAAGTANDGQAAATQLLGLKPTLDQQIEAGAPGFQNYLQQYSAMSKPIDAMEYLQGKLPTDAQGNVQLGRLDTFIKGINRSQAGSGYSQADSITPEQYQGLSDLRDDMRLGSRIDLGKARGSDTNVNLYTSGKIASMVQGATPKIASVITGTAGALTGAPIEGGLIGFGAPMIANKLAQVQLARSAAVRAAAEGHLDNRLLNPYGR
jgi:hypothetical protein